MYGGAGFPPSHVLGFGLENVFDIPLVRMLGLRI